MSDRISLTVQEAAEATGLSTDVIRRAGKTGALPIRYPTAKGVILVDDIKAWLAAAPTERQTA